MDQISTLIKGIDPLDKLEVEHQKRALDWVASGADLFRLQPPNVPPMHLISYFVPIDPVRRQILLVDHKKAGLWLPPGGHIDEGEHPKEAASREMEEELFTKASFLLE